MNKNFIKICQQKISIWKNLKIRRDRINPSLSWFILVVLFFLGLGLIFLVIGYQNILLSEIRENPNLTQSKIERIDEEKLKLILVDHERRSQEFNSLILSKPTIIDPAL